jgi:hypothetical protein
MVSNHLLRKYALERKIKMDQNLKRRLGIQSIGPTKTRGAHSQIVMSESIALKVMSRLGLDPYDVGI